MKPTLFEQVASGATPITDREMIMNLMLKVGQLTDNLTSIAETNSKLLEIIERHQIRIEKLEEKSL